MLRKDLIERFLAVKSIAVVGVSRKKDIPANGIFEKFRNAGYKVYPINPNTEEIDGVKCYSSISGIPEIPESVLLAGPPEVSESVVKECIELGVKNIWMHRGIGTGSYSANAANICKENGIEAITNGCPLMFVKPVDPFHMVLKWFK